MEAKCRRDFSIYPHSSKQVLPLTLTLPVSYCTCRCRNIILIPRSLEAIQIYVECIVKIRVQCMILYVCSLFFVLWWEILTNWTGWHFFSSLPSSSCHLVGNPPTLNEASTWKKCRFFDEIRHVYKHYKATCVRAHALLDSNTCYQQSHFIFFWQFPSSLWLIAMS